MIRPINYTTEQSLEDLAASRNYPIEFGRDSRGDYAAVVTREGTEYRARLAAVAAPAAEGVAS